MIYIITTWRPPRPLHLIPICSTLTSLSTSMPSSPPSGYEQWFPEDEYTTAPNEFSEASNTWGLSDDQYLDGIFPPVSLSVSLYSLPLIVTIFKGPAHDPQLFADFGTFPGLYPPPFFNEAGSNIAQGENPGDSMTLGATNEPYYSVPVPQVGLPVSVYSLPLVDANLFRFRLLRTTNNSSPPAGFLKFLHHNSITRGSPAVSPHMISQLLSARPHRGPCR